MGIEMPEKINAIVDDIHNKPTDMLALGRTLMANERTLLGYVRTSIGFLGGGIALIKYFEDLILVILGWFVVAASFFFIALGIKRFLDMKKILKKAHAKLSMSV